MGKIDEKNSSHKSEKDSRVNTLRGVVFGVKPESFRVLPYNDDTASLTGLIHRLYCAVFFQG